MKGLSRLFVPDKDCVVSAAWESGGEEEEEEAQLDCSNGSVITTWPSGWSRAALRGLMELNRTLDRQPVKLREVSSESPPSNSKHKQYGQRKANHYRLQQLNTKGRYI